MKLNLYLLKSTVVAALGGLLFGFDTAVIAGTTHALTDTFRLSPAALGLTVSVALWGTILGSMFAGIPGDKIGRRDRPCLCAARASASGTSLFSASTSFCSLGCQLQVSNCFSAGGRGSFARFLHFRAPWNVLALVDPALHANHAVRGVRLRETEINFRAVQPARHAHFDAFAAEAQRRIHRFAHRPAKRHALFELQRNRLSDELGVQLRAVHFLDVDVHFALGALLHEIG